MEGDLHPIDASMILGRVLGWIGPVGGRARMFGNSKVFGVGDPHWKRVDKDRAKRKAVRKQKQQARRSGR